MYGVNDAEIAHGQYVRTMETEHEEHLGGPSSKPLDRDQTLDNRFVAKRVELVEDKATVTKPGAQIAQVTHLLAAQPNASQRPVVKRGQFGGAGNHLIRKERHQPAEDGRGCFCRELLTDDRANERGQVIFALPFGHQARTDLLDRAPENRIAPHQRSPRASVVVGRKGAR